MLACTFTVTIGDSANWSPLGEMRLQTWTLDIALMLHQLTGGPGWSMFSEDLVWAVLWAYNQVGRVEGADNPRPTRRLRAGAGDIPGSRVEGARAGSRQLFLRRLRQLRELRLAERGHSDAELKVRSRMMRAGLPYLWVVSQTEPQPTATPVAGRSVSAEPGYLPLAQLFLGSALLLVFRRWA